MPRLTILICTHNRVDLLARTLASINAASKPGGWEMDILVAANACCDGTHDYLDRYRAEAHTRGWLPLTWFAEPMAGKSYALNSALPRVAGDLVAFVDDDHRVDANWLVTLTQTIETHPEFGIYCGRILPDWDGREPAWVHDTGPYRIYPLPIPRQDFGEAPCALTASGTLPGGGNLVVRQTWLTRIGPFRTELGPTGHDLGGAEDMEWLQRGLALGAKLYYTPQALQYHYVDLDRLRLGYLMRKAYQRSASVMALEGRHNGVPLYLYRKLAGYAWGLVTGLSTARWRFYLVRCAATLGEISACRGKRTRSV